MIYYVPNSADFSAKETRLDLEREKPREIFIWLTQGGCVCGRWCVSKESFQRSTETEVGERDTMEERVKSENRKIVPSVLSLFKYRKISCEKNYISLITLESLRPYQFYFYKTNLIRSKNNLRYPNNFKILLYTISEIIPSHLFLN